MNSLTLKFGLLAVVSLLPAGAAEVNRSWEELVNNVQVGKSVVVKRMNGVQDEGKLLSIGAESITLRLDGKPAAIPRDEVFRVRYANIRRKHTLIGMAIGAAAGAAIFGIGSREYSDAGAVALAGAVLGVGPGAAVGGALPIGPPLYEAQVAPKKGAR